jgi:hypothetical protein
MNVTIKTIKHSKQRYPTIGDWYFDKNDDLVIKVSVMGDRRFEMLVAVHELIEVLICDEFGITDEEVTAFDIAFERKRLPGNKDEPGNDAQAPYFQEHQFATKVEKMLAKKLKVNWREYEKAAEVLM